MTRDVGTRPASFGRSSDQSIKAFTLIELLVVVAIISLLMAVLIPSLQKAKDRARAIKCGANLRAFGSVMQLYLGEFGGHAPAESGFKTYMTSTSNGVGAFPAWGKAQTCAGTANGYGDGFSYKASGVAYGFHYPGFNVARSKTPQDIVFAGDTVFLNTITNPGSPYLYDDGSGLGSIELPSKLAVNRWDTLNYQPRYHARHGNAANIAWYDGHVSAERLYRPAVPTRYDPNFLIANYKQGILTPFPSSVPFTTFLSIAQSDTTKAKADYFYTPNAE